MVEKQSIRRQIKTLIKSLSKVEKQAMSRHIMAQLEANVHFAGSHTVVLFSSLPDEVQTDSILLKYAQKKRILLPVVKGNDILLCPFLGFEKMKKGAFGILEPTDISHPITNLSSIDTIVVPGVAFDIHGHRLGRGKGYYDRLLSQKGLENAYKLGICFPCQIVDTLPTEPHDIAMDNIISVSSQSL